MDFFDKLAECTNLVDSYLAKPEYKTRFNPLDLRNDIFAYLQRSGKRLRPSVLMWSAGAVGGNPDDALPAACAVELFHTWTLVHDDVIDNDDRRRGGPTVHTLASEHAKTNLGYSQASAIEYGRNLAILTGDVQHGWCVSLLCECALSGKYEPAVLINIINLLETYVVNTLIEGETLDVQYEQVSIDELSDKDIIKMLWAKTGVLYEFSARAGAMLGLNTCNLNHPMAEALAGFASDCGTAFQLQDDILGLLGDEEKLGKPVGSDIREGKKTLIVYNALNSANKDEREILKSVLGKQDAVQTDVDKVTEIMLSLGAVKKTSDLALEYIKSALKKLETIPDSQYKQLLKSWADFMVNRAV